MSESARAAEWVRPPRQRRSRDTMNRILDAAEELIAEKAWDDVTIREVVSRARTSIGSFYARFPDKDALLHGLDERVHAEVASAVEPLTDPGRWADATLEELLRELLGFFVRLFRDRPGLHRLLVLVPRLRPDERFVRMGLRYRELIDRMSRLLLVRREAIAHPDAERAVRTAVVTGALMIREAVVFPDGPAGALAEADGELVEEYTRMILRYLTGNGAT